MIALAVMHAAWVVILMLVAAVVFRNNGAWIALAFSVLLMFVMRNAYAADCSCKFVVCLII